MPSPEVRQALDAAVIRLNANFDKYVDEASYLAQLEEWYAGADRNPWMTPELVDAALEQFLDEPNRERVPPIGMFTDTCRQIKHRQDQRAAGLALPPPEAWPAATSAKEAARRRLDELLKAAKIGANKPRARAPQSDYRDRQRTVTVEWNDGETSTVELLDEQHARLANRWLNDHTPNTPQRAPERNKTR